MQLWSKNNKYAEDLKFDATSHRVQLVFRPVSRANSAEAIHWTERASDFGLDALTTAQSRALITYNNELKVLYETADDAGFKIIARTYVGVTISPKALAVYGFTEASYCLSMMGGWEYDIQLYSNFLVEPCDKMKTLMGLVNSTKTTPDSYVRLEKTGNDVVTLDKGGKQLNNHAFTTLSLATTLRAR